MGLLAQDPWRLPAATKCLHAHVFTLIEQ